MNLKTSAYRYCVSRQYSQKPDPFQGFITSLSKKRHIKQQTQSQASVVTRKKPDAKTVSWLDMVDTFQSLSKYNAMDRPLNVSYLRNQQLKSYSSNTNTNSSSPVNDRFEELMKKREYKEAYQSIVSSHDDLLPSFYLIRVITAFAVKNLEISDIIKLKEKAKISDLDLYNNEYQFDHYLAHGYALDGQTEQSICLVKDLVDTQGGSSKVKTVLCAALKDITTTQDSCISKAMDMAQYFYEERCEYYPAFLLWKNLFLSSSIGHHVIAEELLNKFPDLLDCQEMNLQKFVEYCLAHPDNITLIPRLTQILLKYEMTEQMSEVLSHTLINHSTNRDLPQCEEILKYAKEQSVFLSAESLRRFLQFQHQIKVAKNAPSIGTSLMKLFKKKEKMKEKFEYKF